MKFKIMYITTFPRTSHIWFPFDYICGNHREGASPSHDDDDSRSCMVSSTFALHPTSSLSSISLAHPIKYSNLRRHRSSSLNLFLAPLNLGASSPSNHFVTSSRLVLDGRLTPDNNQSIQAEVNEKEALTEGRNGCCGWYLTDIPVVLGVS